MCFYVSSNAKNGIIAKIEELKKEFDESESDHIKYWLMKDIYNLQTMLDKYMHRTTDDLF